MHVIVYVVYVNFGDKILLRGEEYKTQGNVNFSQRGKNDKLPLQYRQPTLNFLDLE